ncbi:hypothetical protein IZ6_02120 [Terrihabitans soli]|uniref:Heme exporter protein D n=1 Tax=Terrihabitans soli TaxID=708113 RepID=A0A6S6QNI2_9HYPH|nr:heme exporter protein CcmD [Terrihabitans soli]BCJ89477.1 hypothetical protein IZ6_02120 [Terrihabitans soli]
MNDHFFYIAASYGFTALIVLALILWAWRSHRTEAHALAKLEAKLGRKD